MTLIDTDIQILEKISLSNPIVQQFIMNEDYYGLSIYLNDYPLKNLNNILEYLTARDRARIFAENDFTKWYSALCTKIEKTTDFNPIVLVNGASITLKEINNHSVQIIKDLIVFKIEDATIQKIFLEVFKRDLLGLFQSMMICYAFDETISLDTLNNLAIEASFDYLRWQSLGLSSPISELDLHDLFAF